MPQPTVEEFLQAMIQGVVTRIGPVISQQIQGAPPKVYEVSRVAVDGTPRREKTELPQIVAELTDQLRIHGLAVQQQTAAIQELTKVMDANRKIGRQMLARADADEDT